MDAETLEIDGEQTVAVSYADLVKQAQLRTDTTGLPLSGTAKIVSARPDPTHCRLCGQRIRPDPDHPSYHGVWTLGDGRKLHVQVWTCRECSVRQKRLHDLGFATALFHAHVVGTLENTD